MPSLAQSKPKDETDGRTDRKKETQVDRGSVGRARQLPRMAFVVKHKSDSLALSIPSADFASSYVKA